MIYQLRGGEETARFLFVGRAARVERSRGQKNRSAPAGWLSTSVRGPAKVLFANSSILAGAASPGRRRRGSLNEPIED
jgi:hypothetical protein